MHLDKLRSYLQEELRIRKTVNKRYSIRAFSRDLGIAQTSLNAFLSGRRELSFQNLSRVFRYLRERSAVACSWCGKPKKQTRVLVGGPRRQFICGDCLDVCAEIIKEGRVMRV